MLGIYSGHCLYYLSQNQVDTDTNKGLNSKDFRKLCQSCTKLEIRGRGHWIGWWGRGMWRRQQIKSWAIGLIKSLQSLMSSHGSGLSPLRFLLVLGKILQQWVSTQWHRYVYLSYLEGKAGGLPVPWKSEHESCFMMGKDMTIWS